MATTIPYPLINGYRHSFSSIKLQIARLTIIGFKSISYDRSRSRTMVYGNSADPIGKTRGKNEYKMEAELYLAEYNFLMQSLGNGYGDQFFQVFVDADEDGSDIVHDVATGCTLDSSEAGGSEGTDPLVRKVTFNPIKILFGGRDDMGRPLLPPAQ